jgi:peroxiredoxin
MFKSNPPIFIYLLFILLNPGLTMGSEKGALGTRIPSTTLTNTENQKVNLLDFKDAKVVVLAFLGTNCPVSNAYLPKLEELSNKFHDSKVQFIGIYANSFDSFERVRKHREEYKISFPTLLDHHQTSTELLHVNRIGEVVVLDARRVVRYQGRISDQIGLDYRKESATREDLKEAISECLQNKKISIPSTEVVGCLITPNNKFTDNSITYHKDIAPILLTKCAECHHPKTAAPFSL